MLVLSRRLGEEIHLSVAEDFVWKPGMVITISLESFSGAITRLGVIAPQEVLVRRGELPSRPPRPLSAHVAAQRQQPPQQEPQTDG